MFLRVSSFKIVVIEKNLEFHLTICGNLLPRGMERSLRSSPVGAKYISPGCRSNASSPGSRMMKSLSPVGAEDGSKHELFAGRAWLCAWGIPGVSARF